jgi:hypothetical protein
LKKHVCNNGIYDGKTVKLTGKFKDYRKYRVVVTFIEELPEEDKMTKAFSSNVDGMELWEIKAEDLYQDYLTKK